MTPKITAEQLAEFVQLEQERKELDRKSRALAKRQDMLRDHCKAELDAAGQTSCVRGGYRVSIIDGRANVAWKDELLKAVGPLKVGEIADAAPPTKRVVVEPTGAPARRAA